MVLYIQYFKDRKIRATLPSPEDKNGKRKKSLFLKIYISYDRVTRQAVTSFDIAAIYILILGLHLERSKAAVLTGVRRT